MRAWPEGWPLSELVKKSRAASATEMSGNVRKWERQKSEASVSPLRLDCFPGFQHGLISQRPGPSVLLVRGG